jgi:hypothetical protein
MVDTHALTHPPCAQFIWSYNDEIIHNPKLHWDSLVPGQGNARIDYGPHKRLDEQPVMCIEEMVSLMYASE